MSPPDETPDETPDEPAVPEAMVSARKLLLLAPNMSEAVAAELAPLLDVACRDVGITGARLAQFLGEIDEETAGFSAFSENLNYSAARLLAVFPNVFRNGVHPEAYARDPERIANLVYANRFGNGDEASGDGWRFRGRGLLDHTFRANYANLSEFAGVDLVADPDQLHDLATAVKCAVAFWTAHNLNVFADAGDGTAIRRIVNGGLNGEDAAAVDVARAAAIFDPRPD